MKLCGRGGDRGFFAAGKNLLVHDEISVSMREEEKSLNRFPERSRFFQEYKYFWLFLPSSWSSKVFLC